MPRYQNHNRQRSGRTQRAPRSYGRGRGSRGGGGSAAGNAYHAHGREKIYIYGKHALAEALANAPHAVKRVFLSPEVEDAQLRASLKKQNLAPSELKSGEMGRMVGRETAHQGVIAVIDPGAIIMDFDAFLQTLRARNGGRGADERTMVVLLDELTDPHNVGAIIRSAAAFGAAGVLLPVHHQAPITGAVVKSSAGMTFRVPLVQIGNVNQAVDALKKMAFRTYGLVMDGAVNVTEEPFDAPSLFIVGNEGSGIREKTLARCDVGLRIPMDPRCESLNASVSAAVVLYAWSMRHPL